MDDALEERAAAMKAAEAVAGGATAFTQGVTILRKVGVPVVTIQKIFEDALDRAEIGLPFPPIDALLGELGYEPTPRQRDEDLLSKPAKERDKIIAARRRAARSDFRKATVAFDELAAVAPDAAEHARFRYMSIMAEALQAVLKPESDAREPEPEPEPEPDPTP
jgi:hypothetical protein